MGGITEVVAPAAADFFGSALAGSIAADATAGLAGGALLGGAEGALTGGNVLSGALKGGIGGALTGGAVGAGPSIGGALGIGGTAGDVLGGAAGGALGSALTGGKPLTGALEGGAAGGIASQFGSQTPGSTGGAPTGTAAATGGGGPGVGAASTAAPASVGSGGGDLSFSDAVENLQNGGAGAAAGSAGGGGSSLNNFTNANTWGQTLGANGDLSPSLASAANAAATAPPAVTPPPDSGGGLFSGLLGKNASPLGVGISGLGLAGSAIQSQKAIKGENQIKDQAAADASQGAQLQSYLQSGQLPPGLQQGITQASNAAKATIKSRYASMGMSGSSSEQQELAQVDQNAQAQSSQIALQLLQTGISESGSAAQLYQAIMQNTLGRDQNLSSAISNFAGAASGGIPAGRLVQPEA